MKTYELSYVRTDEKILDADFLVAVDPAGEENARTWFTSGMRLGFLERNNEIAIENRDFDITAISNVFHKIREIDDNFWGAEDDSVTLDDVLKYYENVHPRVVTTETIEVDEDYDYHKHILSNAEIVCIGAEYFCSVETLSNEFMDDEYNGTADECIDYCRKNGLARGITAQIAYVTCEDGIVNFCDRVDDKIPPELIETYERGEWNEEDVQDYAKSHNCDIDAIDADEFLDYIAETKEKNAKTALKQDIER